MGDLTGYFSKHELTCKCGCGLFIYEAKLIIKLTTARISAGIPFVINSGTRCLPHNMRIGGTPGSSHLKGLAVDVRVRNSHERYLIVRALLNAGFDRVTPKEGFVHADVDESKVREVMWL